MLFDFVDPDRVDGLLVWYAGIAEGIGLAHAAQFLDRYEALPVVTIGGQLANYPDLSIDNYHGVRTAVEHLIEVHHRQHIGIIRGPVGHPDADERYRGYIETLQMHGLRANPDHVAETLFEFQTAATVTEAAITRWLQDSTQKLDAVVTGSDYIALPAIRAIQAAGLRVPDDISVVGFDDVDDAQASIPSLTTVRQPFYDLGYQATEMLLALLDGQSVPARSIMPVQLVVRESCGCVTRSLPLANVMIDGNLSLDLDSLLPSYRSPPRTLVRSTQGLKILPEHVENLVDCFQRDLSSGTSHQFLSALRLHLADAMESHLDGTAWQDVISVLRRYILSISNGEIGLLGETLFNQARVLVAEMNQRAHIRHRLRVEQQIENLRRVSDTLITSFGKQLLMDTLCDLLPELGFPSFYLSLYDDPEQPAAWSRLILAYEDNQRLGLPPDGLRFPTRQLIPESLPASRRTDSLTVEPLFFRDEQLGILVLEVGPTEGAVYENIRAQVSSALQGSRLLRQVQNHAAQLEQRVAERTEELTQTVEQLQSEVAERHRAEESLRLISFAIERVSDAVYWIDPDGQIVDVNEAACRTLGYKHEELVGMSLEDIDPMLLLNSWPETWRKLRKEGTLTLETLHKSKKGRTIPVEIVANYVEFGGRELNCAFARDITQRKASEEALRKSEEYAREFQEKLKTLQEVSLELVATQSIEKLCSRAIELGHNALGYDRIGILLFENEEQSKVSRFGIESTGELRVEHGMDYSIETDRVVAPMLTNRESVFVSEDIDLSDFESVVGRGWNVITGIWDGDTSIGWMAADNFFEQKPLIPYQVELLKLYGLTVGHLVTRKRAEAAIRRLNDELEQRVIERTSQLKASNQELESFAYVVSHDLKAPLRAISQLASWLGSDYAAAFDDNGRQMLDLLTTRTRRMHDLIDGILQYSRIGRVKEQKYSVDLNRLVQNVVDGLDPPPHIRVRIESELPTVTGDRIRLEQVFQNLIGNSIKFMDKTEGWVIVDCYDEGQQWRFSVSDNGPGIDPRYHDKIFQIFQTLDSHDKYEGTGIGLTLVKKIVERWGGRIWVESAVGQGCTFLFTIPQEQSDAKQ